MHRLRALLLFAILSSAVLLAFNQTGEVKASNLGGIISNDTTWSKADSPYTLTGNVLVSHEVTLSIEPGVTVYLNGYYTMVNGTLQTRGTASNQIVLDGSTASGGYIEFTQYSSGWNEATGTGSILEYTEAYNIQSNVTLKISNADIHGLSVGASSIITGSTIAGTVNVGACGTIVSNNVINGGIIGVSPTITDNTIIGGGQGTSSGQIGDYAVAIEVSGPSTIKNNNITGTVTGDDLTVSNNIIVGGNPTDEGWPTYRRMDPTSAIYVTGRSTIEKNTIRSDGGYGVTVRGDNTVVSQNQISNCVTGIQAYGEAQVTQNTITNCGTGVQLGADNIVIQDNTIYSNSVGVGAYPESSGTVSGNTLIDNETKD